MEFDVENSSTPSVSTIGTGGKDIQIAQGAGTSNNTLTINTQQGNVDIHELTANQFKTIDVTLNSASAAQNVAIDLNGPDDINFSDNGSLVTIDAAKVNLSADNRNWSLYAPSRAIQIDSTSLGTGSYTVNAGSYLNLNGDVMTNGGAISLTSDDSYVGGTGIHLLKSVRVDSNADDTGNSTSTGAAGSIVMVGTLVSSTVGSSRTLTVDSSSSTAAGGQILMYSGASDRDASGAFIGAFLTGLTLTAKGSTNTNDGEIYLNGYGTNYYLNGDFSCTGNTHIYNAIIDTEQGNHSNGGNITFSGQDLGTDFYASITLNTATTAAGKNGGNVDLFGTFNHSTFSAAELLVNTTGGAGGTSGSIALPAVTTSYPADTGFSGNQSYTGGVITLNGNLTTNEGDVILSGDTRLAASVVIDTWQYRSDVQTGTAGSVTIGGAGISALAAGRNLTIDTSTDTGSGYFDDGSGLPPTGLFAHSGGNVAISAGNAGGAYVNALVVNTSAGGAHNTDIGVNGTIALNTVGTEGTQTYTGGATTVSGAITTNGGNIDLSGVTSLALSGAAVIFDTDRTGGNSAAGSLFLGAHTLNGPVAVTIDTSADGGGSGTNFTLTSAGAVTPLSSLNATAATLTVGGTGVTASGAITLGAMSALNVNATVTNAAGSGGIAMNAGTTIGLGAGVSSAGAVTLNHGGALTQSAGTVSAPILNLNGLGMVGTVGAPLATSAATIVLNKAAGAGATFVNDSVAVAVSGATAGGLTLNSPGGITVDQNLTTADVTTLDADSSNDGTGIFTVASGKTLATTDAVLNITAADVVLTGALDSGAAATGITASANRTIGLGLGSGNMSLAGAELGQITAAGLTLTTTSLSGNMTVDGVTWVDSMNTGAITLNAGGKVTFTTDDSTFYNGVAVNANNGIAVGTDVTAMYGNIVLDGDETPPPTPEPASSSPARAP